MNLAKKQEELAVLFGDRVVLKNEGDCLRLSGAVDRWEDVVKAGQICAKIGSSTHVVNDIQVYGLEKSRGRIPAISDHSLDGTRPDILIIGAGVVGCAIARELSKYKLDVLIAEKEYDVALHASSRNDGMIHPGIDIKPGLLKKKLNNRGNRLYAGICSDLSVPFQRCGQYLCFRKRKYLPLLCLTIPYWAATGVGRVRVYTARRLREREPGISPEIQCAIYFKRAGIVCPFGFTIALAENAVQNGVKLSLDTAVLGMEVEGGLIRSVRTNRGTVYPKIVVNAAGVFSEDIAAMAGDRFFSIHPRKGTNTILDKKARRHIRTIYSLMGTQSKEIHTKGGGVVGTIDGNVLVGPDAEETPLKEDFSTTAQSVAESFSRHKKVAPWLSAGDIITYFSGIRAATYEEDFIVEKGRRTKNLIHAAGIQSPGLTAAPAIAERVAKLAVARLEENGDVERNAAFQPKRPAIVRSKELSVQERDALIASDPDYGEIICRCEEISKGEILAAMRRPVPCSTVDGIKRRVRPGMGRCQGGFCGPQIVRLISETFGMPEEAVRKGCEGSELLAGPKGRIHENL